MRGGYVLKSLSPCPLILNLESSMTPKILIVEDEIEISQLLEDYLNKFGYLPTSLHHGDEVLPYVKQNEPDLILLDVMLPGMDGMTLCREIRKFSTVPIIMVTARIEEVDRLLGLELEADDYITKPFSPREVIARIKAVLRRASQPIQEENKDLLSVGPIHLNKASHQVLIEDHELVLTPSEFGLLRVMMEQPNRVFSRNDLLIKVQGYDFNGYDRTIDTHIKNLRKKLSNVLPDKEIIVAVYGVGYQLKPPTP